MLLDAIAKRIGNVTEHKQANDALLRSEKKMDSVLKNTPDYVMEIDKDCKILYLNHPVEGDNPIGMSALDYVASAYKKAYRETVNKVFKDGKQRAIETEVATPDGALHTFIIRFGAIMEGKIVKTLVSTISDITKRKKTENALRKSEEQFKSLVLNIPGMTYRCKCDKTWTMLYMSKETKNVCGYPVSDFIDDSVRTYESIIHRDDTAFVSKSIHSCIKAGKHWDIEYRIIHKDSSVRWVREKGRSITE